MKERDTKIVKLIPSNMSIHIASWREDNGIMIFSKELENKEVEVTISYPLKTKYVFTYKDKDGIGCVTDLISNIVSKYRFVYSKSEEFGIWGHCIGDLVIEGLNLDLTTNKIILYIGS